MLCCLLCSLFLEVSKVSEVQALAWPFLIRIDDSSFFLLFIAPQKYKFLPRSEDGKQTADNNRNENTHLKFMEIHKNVLSSCCSVE